ncbi:MULTISPECIES: hypothetical protein [Siminovitchia]|uniref:Uncharacterized protein n=1 Tax=Siminovitchia sediminis TaxID=1274353 RepID=A0ABW4KMG0_9BACI|nr:hypothetical protein [Siminovitchia fortis]
MSNQTNSIDKTIQEDIIQEDMQGNDIVYFVSYYHSRGMGNAEVIMSDYIINVNQVGSLQKLIEEEYKVNNVTIINFFPLRLEETAENRD